MPPDRCRISDAEIRRTEHKRVLQESLKGRQVLTVAGDKVLHVVTYTKRTAAQGNKHTMSITLEYL